jgi:hypothetical protein
MYILSLLLQQHNQKRLANKALTIIMYDAVFFLIPTYSQGCYDIYFICPQCSRINYCCTGDEGGTFSCNVNNLHINHIFNEHKKLLSEQNETYEKEQILQYITWLDEQEKEIPDSYGYVPTPAYDTYESNPDYYSLNDVVNNKSYERPSHKPPQPIIDFNNSNSNDNPYNQQTLISLFSTSAKKCNYKIDVNGYNIIGTLPDKRKHPSAFVTSLLDKTKNNINTKIGINMRNPYYFYGWHPEFR